MDTESKTSPELEAMRQQVEQEIEERWKIESTRGHTLSKPEDISGLTPGKDYDPEIYAESVDTYKANTSFALKQ